MLGGKPIATILLKLRLWENAPVLKDTPKFRAELMRAYEKFWAPYIQKDEAGIRQSMRYILRGIASAVGLSVEDYLAQPRASDALYATHADAQRIEWPSELFPIFNNQRNMVTITPNPLKFIQITDQKTFSTNNIYFFRDGNGDLVAGHWLR